MTRIEPTRGARRLRMVAGLPPVVSRARLAKAGFTAHHIDSQLAAGRWRRKGHAVVLHTGPLTRIDRDLVALINCGPHAMLTAFSALRVHGLRGWDRDDVHVLAPAHARRPQLDGVRLYRTRDWAAVDRVPDKRLHRAAPAAILAAAGFDGPRPACGLLAAVVQQRAATPAQLRLALDRAPRVRHRAALVLAVADVEQGAQALSEIDFARLCRRAGLPEPVRQAVRVETSGRRRYLDAEWRLPDGRRVAVEIDGAAHLEHRQWSEDQLRQNEIVLGGTLVLRFPVIVLRHQPELVIAQLRRALR